MSAARRGQTNIVVELVNEGADIHKQDKVCCLFLHLTLCMRHHYLVSIRCIDLSDITQDGDSALILASGPCGTEAVVELVKAGADVNLQNNVCWCCV